MINIGDIVGYVINIGDIVGYVDTWSERPKELKGRHYIRHGEVCEVYPYHVVVKTKCGYKVSVSKVDLFLASNDAEVY